MSNIQYNAQIGNDLDDLGFSLSRKLYNVPMEFLYNMEFEISAKDYILDLAKEMNANIATSRSFYHALKTESVENYHTTYLIQFDNFLVTFKEVSIKKNQTIFQDDVEELLNSIKEDENINTKRDIYKIYEVNIYYNVDEQESVLPIIKLITDKLETSLYKQSKIPTFYTIGMSQYGYELRSNVLENMKIYNDEHIIDHYEEGFLAEFNNIKNNLINKNHGLILLHGDPGTGKTTIIRQLIAEICDTKKVIYVPSYMVENLASPEFMSFLAEFEESVLILEDAEMVLKQRDDEFGTQAVSNLLNITNGLLNDSTKIQVIATFNMDKTKLDKALLRAGRLINEWHFEKLTVEQCGNIITKYNLEAVAMEPMSISELYNYDSYLKEKNKTSNKKKKKTDRNLGFK